MEDRKKWKERSPVGKKGGLPRDSAGWGGEMQATRAERARVREGGETKLTDRYSRDLTRMAAMGALGPSHWTGRGGGPGGANSLPAHQK